MSFSAKLEPTFKKVAALEAAGEWRAVVETLIPLSHQEDFEVSAHLARALAFHDQWEAAESLISLLAEKQESLSREALALLLLTESRLHRIHQRWELARQTAVSARERLVLTPHRALYADALFAEAFAEAELGHIYRALALFHEIAENSNYSQYRRDLSRVNEGWLLYDIGQAHAVFREMEKLPPLLKFRFELSKAVLTEDQSFLDRLLGSHGLFSQQRDVEKNQILYFLTEWITLHPDQETNWVRDEVQVRLKQTENNLVLKAMSIALEGQKIVDLNLSGTNWRTQMDVLLLRMLSALRLDSTKAQDILRNEIDPFLEKYRLRTPFVPSSLALNEDQSLWPWQILLRRRLGFSCETKATSQNKKVILERSQGLLISDGKSLDLRRSPTALKILSILAGPSGRSLSKRELHEHLTGTRYVFHLHDSRLHKLLKRLHDRAQETLGIELWYMPGDNRVVLSVTIELQ